MRDFWSEEQNVAKTCKHTDRDRFNHMGFARLLPGLYVLLWWLYRFRSGHIFTRQLLKCLMDFTSEKTVITTFWSVLRHAIYCVCSAYAWRLQLEVDQEMSLWLIEFSKLINRVNSCFTFKTSCFAQGPPIDHLYITTQFITLGALAFRHQGSVTLDWFNTNEQKRRSLDRTRH